MSSLNEGDRVQFELEVDRRGKTAAVNLSAISKALPNQRERPGRSPERTGPFSNQPAGTW
jgi:hypothetical protein